MILLLETQDSFQGQSGDCLVSNNLRSCEQSKGLPSSAIPLHPLFNLPGLKGVACQGRWQALQAYEFAQFHGLTHFYVDSATEACTPAVLNSLTNPTTPISQTPIYHSNYRHPIASPDPKLRLAAREALMMEISVASRLRAPLILHGTSDPSLHVEMPDRQAALAAFDAELFELESHASQLGVQLWLENLPVNEAAVFSCMADFEYILARHPTVKFILDVGHANIANDAPFEALRNFPEKIAALSLSDNDGKSDLHQSLGKGSIPFENLLDMIEDIKWQGIYVFETMESPLDHDLHFLLSLLSLLSRK